MSGPSKRSACVLVWAVLTLSPASGQVQQSAAPKRVLVLQWYDREYPANVTFDNQFRTALQPSAPEGIEYYSEYLETNKFPGENQSELLSRYLQRKYAGLTIDVVVARASASLEFLLEHRSRLFPLTPIVFSSGRIVPASVLSKSGATGIVYSNSYHKTVDLALGLHPKTKHLFVVSGTLTHDKSVEAIARDALQGYKNRLAIAYLTDLSLKDLTKKLKNLPKDSVILYAWQQVLETKDKVVETRDVLAQVAREATAPVYGMSYVNVGIGIIGGYVWTPETNAAKLAEMTLRVLNGERSADIPVEHAPDVPMFDWRQLQRWSISEARLPSGSIIRFRELTVWQQFKWHIVGAIFLIGLQALLIGALLVQRQRAHRTRSELEQYKGHLENLVQQRTTELVEARDQAQAANRSKSLFLANISHELRTPLNAILGFSGIVLRDATLSEQHRNDLTIVESSGEHLLRLIDNVLDMAKIETTGTTVDSESIDLHFLVSDTVNMLRERAAAKNLDLSLDVSSRVPQFVRLDPGKLRQVLTNLLGNAVKYTDVGSIVVSLDARRRDNLSDLLLIFDVVDTGIGIAAEDQARIFDPFVQVGSTRTRKGTGLGLSISRHFVELLDGTIQVESTPGVGSRFRVELPAQSAEASEVIAGAVNVGHVIRLDAGQPDYRILIVEDQRENWLLLERVLQTAGFQVRVAEDGVQAIEAFKIWRPHFIWMDIRLPVLGGMEAARRIRELDGGRNVKIVAVTASAFTSQREEVLAADFDDFVRKPYRSREIFDCIAQHLGVCYFYEPGPGVALSEPLPTLRPEDLAVLPTALRDELENAVITLDSARIALLVSQVSEQNASLGSVLGRFAHKFAYSPILHALRSSRSRSKEARV